ncbi:O-antigen ligase family protein [Nitrincola tapanii]|uniref:O-antigen polymerase n=1 Tax=Nitrincola tapanii TaxID=1708751 RepID=A0A5A9W4P5_9GAMM|nr:O-antigen ligase family protein [Nitrincola tapanii]KAA0875760.1 O-antigen polymerase [Nitrincola tapanii]
MPSRAAHPPSSLSERLVVVGLLALILWLPIPLGSNRPWSMALFMILISALALAWGAFTLLNSERTRFTRRSSGRWILISMLSCLLLTQLWGLVQLYLNPTLHLGRSVHQLFLGLSYTLLFVLTVQVFNTRKRLTLLLSVILISGTLQAFYGSITVLSGVDWLPWGQEKSRSSASGSFVNRNHLAGYLAMVLSLGIGLMLALRDGRPFSWRNLLELLLGPKARLRLALIVMVIGLVMTHSRMGNTAFFTSLVIMGSLFILFTPENRGRNSLILISIILIDILIISQFFGFERLKNRLANTEVSISQEAGQIVLNINDLRALANERIYPIIQANPWQGYGAGSFEDVFIGPSGPGFGSHFDHAHNDYFQFWLEYGAIGSLPLALFVLLALFCALKALIQRQSTYTSGLGFGSAMAILAILIHSTTDFNLQIPANAALFTLACAMAYQAAYLNLNKSSKTRSQAPSFSR